MCRNGVEIIRLYVLFCCQIYCSSFCPCCFRVPTWRGGEREREGPEEATQKREVGSQKKKERVRFGGYSVTEGDRGEDLIPTKKKNPKQKQPKKI